MLPSLRLALNTLTGKRGRTILLIGAVTIAASLVVAVGCTVSSVQGMMEQSLTRFLGKADARIIHSGRGRFDQSIVVHGRAAVRHCPNQLALLLYRKLLQHF